MSHFTSGSPVGSVIARFRDVVVFRLAIDLSGDDFGYHNISGEVFRVVAYLHEVLMA